LTALQLVVTVTLLVLMQLVLMQLVLTVLWWGG